MLTEQETALTNIELTLEAALVEVKKYHEEPLRGRDVLLAAKFRIDQAQATLWFLMRRVP